MALVWCIITVEAGLWHLGVSIPDIKSVRDISNVSSFLHVTIHLTTGRERLIRTRLIRSST